MLRHQECDIYDYIVVGAGAAGLFIAEMLARSNKKILLIEQSDAIGSKSSSEQIGWMQFGSLFFGSTDLKVAQACLTNIDILLKYYKFPSNNLTIANGSLAINDQKKSTNWFRSDNFSYYYPIPNDCLKLSKIEITKWKQRLITILERTKEASKHNWDENKSNNFLTGTDDSKITEKLYAAKIAAQQWKRMIYKKNLISEDKHYKDDVSRYFNKYLYFNSHDCTMRTRLILQCLTNQLLANNGKILLNTEIQSYSLDPSGHVVLTSNHGANFKSHKVIFAAGNNLSQFKASHIKSFVSPVLVVRPALCQKNFVNLMPNHKDSLIHVYYTDTDKDLSYSLLSNGDNIDPENKTDKDRSQKNLISRSELLFQNLKENSLYNKQVYFGHIAKCLKKDSLSCHYEFSPFVADKVFFASLSAFSMAPSLAFHVYNLLENNLPKSQICFSTMSSVKYLDDKISFEYHRKLIEYSKNKSSKQKKLLKFGVSIASAASVGFLLFKIFKSSKSESVTSLNQYPNHHELQFLTPLKTTTR